MHEAIVHELYRHNEPPFTVTFKMKVFLKLNPTKIDHLLESYTHFNSSCHHTYIQYSSQSVMTCVIFFMPIVLYIFYPEDIV